MSLRKGLFKRKQVGYVKRKKTQEKGREAHALSQKNAHLVQNFTITESRDLQLEDSLQKIDDQNTIGSKFVFYQ